MDGDGVGIKQGRQNPLESLQSETRDCREDDSSMHKAVVGDIKEDGKDQQRICTGGVFSDIPGTMNDDSRRTEGHRSKARDL